MTLVEGIVLHRVSSKKTRHFHCKYLFSIFLYFKDILYRHEVLRDGIYEVDWTVDFSAEEITFFVTAKTNGFVGFGISYTGSMQYSDIVIGGVFEDGTTYFSVSPTTNLGSLSKSGRSKYRGTNSGRYTIWKLQ